MRRVRKCKMGSVSLMMIFVCLERRAVNAGNVQPTTTSTQMGGIVEGIIALTGMLLTKDAGNVSLTSKSLKDYVSVSFVPNMRTLLVMSSLNAEDA